MTNKEIRKYDLIMEIGKTHPADDGILALFRELAGIDFVVAFEVWEYTLGKHVSTLANGEISDNIEGRVLSMFLGISESRTKQMLLDNPQLLKLIYTNASTAASGENLSILTQLILGSKVEKADEILKLVGSNKNTNMDFGDRMKTIIDDVFNTYCAKSGSKVPNLNRKQTMMLLEHALRIKGANKALLVQRVKELQ